MEQEDLKRAFGQRVRTFREARGLGQEQLAALIDSPSTLSATSSAARTAPAWRRHGSWPTRLAWGCLTSSNWAETKRPDLSRHQRLKDLSGRLAELTDHQFDQAADIFERVIQLARTGEG